MPTPEHEIRKHGLLDRQPATGAPVQSDSETLGFGWRARSVRRRGDGGTWWSAGGFRLSSHRRHEDTAGPERGGDGNRVRDIVLKRTIRAAEPGLAPILVECGGYAGEHDAHRKESGYDGDPTEQHAC